MDTERKTGAVALALIRNNLPHFREFVIRIQSSLKKRAYKRIYRMIQNGIEQGVKSIDDLYMIIGDLLRDVKKSDRLTEALLEFGDYEVLSAVFIRSVACEVDDQKKMVRFTEEEKDRLIKFILDFDNKHQVFIDIRFILIASRALHYRAQALLFNTYLLLFVEYAPSSDLLEVYEMWRELSPDLRWRLRSIIKRGLDSKTAIPVRILQDSGMELVDFSKNPSPVPKDRGKN